MKHNHGTQRKIVLGAPCRVRKLRPQPSRFKQPDRQTMRHGKIRSAADAQRR